MATATFSIQWELQNEGKYTGTPRFQPIRNDLDAHGSFFNLPRLPAEENYDYFRRLQSVIPLRGGPEHEGLVHGITRDLGLEETVGINISPVSSGGRWLAPSPHVEITASQIILYSAYVDESNNTVDRTIDIFEHGEGYLIQDAVSLIQSSEYFVATLGSRMTGEEKSNGLFPGSSSTVVSREWVPASTYFALQNEDVIPGTLFFTEKNLFKKELSREIAVTNDAGLSLTWAIKDFTTRDGEYFVDYKEGVVSVHSTASGRGTCRYRYRNFPWYVRWSPVVVYSFRDENFRDQIFEDENMLDGSTEQGLPSKEGVDILTQIFERSPCLWGE